jgi:hypothetical protein
VFEGVPTYPNAGRFWQMIEKHKCTIFYTAPTAIRSLIKAAEGDEKVHPARSDLTSLRILGSVGEPINTPKPQNPIITRRDHKKLGSMPPFAAYSVNLRAFKSTPRDSRMSLRKAP